MALIVLANSASDSPATPTFHFAISNAEELNKTLIADSNIEVETELEDTHWGTKWIRVRDPDGNVYALEDTGK